MIVFSPVAQQPSSGVEDRFQAIQETLRRADQQTVPAIDLRCDEGSNSRSRSLKRQRFDTAFQETKLKEAATDSPSHIIDLHMFTHQRLHSGHKYQRDGSGHSVTFVSGSC